MVVASIEFLGSTVWRAAPVWQITLAGAGSVGVAGLATVLACAVAENGDGDDGLGALVLVWLASALTGIAVGPLCLEIVSRTTAGYLAALAGEVVIGMATAITIGVVLCACCLLLARASRRIDSPAPWPSRAAVGASSPRPPSRARICSAANAARQAVLECDASVSAHIAASTDELGGRYATGATQLAASLENRVLWLSLAGKVHQGKREELQEYLEERAKMFLPPQHEAVAVVEGAEMWVRGCDAASRSLTRVATALRSTKGHAPERVGRSGLATEGRTRFEGPSKGQIVAAAGSGVLLGGVAALQTDRLIGAADYVVGMAQEAAEECAREILAEEFGEEVAEELAEAAVGVLFPGIGLAFAGWKVLKYGAKIKRIFFDQEPLNRLREHVRTTVHKQGLDATESLRVQLESARYAASTAILQDIDRWESEALHLAGA